MADVSIEKAVLESDGTLTVTGSGFTKTTTTVTIDGTDVPFEIGGDGEIIARDIPPGVTQIEVSKGEITDRAPIERNWTPGDPQTETAGSAESPGTTTSTAEPAAPDAVNPAPTASEIDAGPEESHDLGQEAAPVPPPPEPLASAGSGEGSAPEAGASDSSDTEGEKKSDTYDPGGDAHAPGYKTAEPNKTPGDLTEDDLKTGADVSKEQLDYSSAGAAEKQLDETQPDKTPLEAGEHLPGADFRFRVENTAAGDLNQDPRQPYPTGDPPDPREQFYRINGFYPPEEGEPADQTEQRRQMDADPAT